MKNIKEFTLPDFKNSNLNISATIARFLGAPNKNASLPLLKEELNKNYKNVIFICFDGLGINPIEKNLGDKDFLRKNVVQTLTSTFPSTTTNATTSLITNTLPLEHGWFGWSLYFEDVGRNIDIFLNRDSKTGEKVKITDGKFLRGDYYFDLANTDYEINTIFPQYVEVKNNEKNFQISNIDDLFSNIYYVCNKHGKQFAYAYFDDPDHTMHEFGVSSKEAKIVIEEISKRMKNLYETTKDTLFIITADHGQVDIDEYIPFYKDEHMYNMLETTPFLEPRACGFKVKTGKELEFEEHFNALYGEDFVLEKI